MYAWLTLKPFFSKRLEPLHWTTSVWVDGVAELFAAINGTHETTGRPVDIGINSGRQRITCHASISTVLDTSTTRCVDVTNTSTRLGENPVAVLYPNPDTPDADWTPSSGTDHYALVDETTINGDTDYVVSGAAGDLNLHEVGDLPFTPESIHAVQVTMCARKDDAATGAVQTKVKSGARAYNGRRLPLLPGHPRD